MKGANSEGKSLGKSVRQHFTGDFSGKIAKPMTDGSSISTIDGTETFSNANIKCDAVNEGEYFNLGYTVDGNGDMVISASIDNEVDGVFDRGLEFRSTSGSPVSAKRASGVCSNGIVACSPGTWSGCSYFKWGYDGIALYLQQSKRDDVSVCRCTNNSCGSASSNERSGVLNTLSQGAFQHVAAGSPNFAVSSVKKTASSVHFFGQNMNGCGAQQYSYHSYTGNIDNRAAQAQAQAGSNPDSAYSAVMGSNYMQSNDPNTMITAYANNDINSEYMDSSEESALMTRAGSVHDSLQTSKNGDAQAFGYTDQRLDENGNPIAVSESSYVYISDEASVLYCQVSRSAKTTTLYSDGTNADSVPSARIQKVLEVKECEGTKCPLEAGETIERSCATASAFPEVAARLESIKEAKEDMICSTY
jgi:hypothetical protein